MLHLHVSEKRELQIQKEVLKSNRKTRKQLKANDRRARRSRCAATLLLTPSATTRPDGDTCSESMPSSSSSTLALAYMLPRDPRCGASCVSSSASESGVARFFFLSFFDFFLSFSLLFFSAFAEVSFFFFEDTVSSCSAMSDRHNRQAAFSRHFVQIREFLKFAIMGTLGNVQ